MDLSQWLSLMCTNYLLVSPWGSWQERENSYPNRTAVYRPVRPGCLHPTLYWMSVCLLVCPIRSRSSFAWIQWLTCSEAPDWLTDLLIRRYGVITQAVFGSNVK